MPHRGIFTTIQLVFYRAGLNIHLHVKNDDYQRIRVTLTMVMDAQILKSNYAMGQQILPCAGHMTPTINTQYFHVLITV